MTDPRELSDEQLTNRIKEMSKEERASLRDFIRHLRVFDERRLAAATEHATTFVYCRKELKLGEGEAYRRLQVAAVIDRVPELLDYIESGALSLTVACMLAPFLTKANVAELAEKCRDLSRREAEAVVQAFKTTPAVRDIVRWMGKRTSAPPTPENAESLFELQAVPAAPAAAQSPAESTSSSALPVSVDDGLSEEARLHFTVRRETFEKLRRAQGLLRHKYPKGEFSDVVDDALEALLDRIDRSRKEKPAPPKSVLPGRRRIPEWVKDIVYARDGGRCAFESVDGKRCEASEWLEYDHVRPFALGGASDDPDNVRLLCRAHNQHRAREDFGAGFAGAGSGGEQGELWTGGTFEPGAPACDAEPGGMGGTGMGATGGS